MAVGGYIVVARKTRPTSLSGIFHPHAGLVSIVRVFSECGPSNSGETPFGSYDETDL
jgi:hypothetical protein